MALYPIDIQSGVYRDGTKYQAKGRVYDALFSRWYGSAIGPIGGWRARSSETLSGAPRAIQAWKDNDGTAWLAIGTHSHLYASNRAGDVFDITPVGFTVGRADAAAGGGYGSGYFGTAAYGIPRPDGTNILDATQWSLDAWGETLLGVSPDDEKIYQWSLDTAAKGVKVTNSPSCTSLVVTPERFCFALGTTDPRTVSWCDQENLTVWTPSDTNQAGELPLITTGKIMLGRNVRGGTIILTDIDAHLVTYIGGTDVYSRAKVGDGCGAVSRQCAATYGGNVAWMSLSGFWLYNGYTQQIPCDVFDYIRRDMNIAQKSKVYASVLSEFSEIEWRYCSAASNEIDRCVVWNYQTQKWTIGRPDRTCSIDRGVLLYPVMVGSDGTIYDHEVGYDYGGTSPYVETGPIEIGNGDAVSYVRALIPDDATLGDVQATFYTSFYPDTAEVAHGPYTMSAKTNVRFAGRQFRMRISGAVGTNWRFGTPRVDVLAGGNR